MSDKFPEEKINHQSSGNNSEYSSIVDDFNSLKLREKVNINTLRDKFQSDSSSIISDSSENYSENLTDSETRSSKNFRARTKRYVSNF